MVWTKEQVDLLIMLWKEGLSARQISEKLGNGLSRNAIIGKANRLGLSTAAKSEESNESVTKTLHTLLLPPSPMHNGCRWPINDPLLPDFLFCNQSLAPGRSYCIEHCQVAYRRLAPKDRSKKHDFVSDDFL